MTKNKILLGMILVLAFGLRVILITKSPPALYWEEAALGYDAYSILKTGKDYHGNPWPIVAFESFGDWKPSGYFYALVPFLALFGPVDWAVRLPSLLAGTATVYLVYLIVCKISSRESWALWSALMLAIIPWHIQFSRAGFEVSLATFFLTLGVYWLIKARDKPFYLIGAVLPMVYSMYTYHGLRVLAPLITLSLVFCFRKDYKKTKYLWVSLVLAIILITPIIRAWNSPVLRQRLNETSLWSTSPAVLMTNADRREDGYTLTARLIHHRYLLWSKEFLSGAISHFNPNFLFITGDENPRHQSGIFALLYPWMAVPLIWGLILLTHKQNRKHGWLILWILLATIPPALTNLTPHTLRFLPAVPALAIIIGLGMEGLGRWVHKHKMAIWLNGFMAAIMIGSVVIYAYDLWWVYPKRESQSWQFGYKEAIQLIKSDYEQEKSIYFTRNYGRPSIYVLWYLQVNPKLIQEQQATRNDQGELLRVGNVYFDETPPSPGSVLVSSKPLTNFNLSSKINFLDQKPAFYIYEN